MEESQYYGYGLPIDISSHGGQLDQIFWVMHIFMLVLFVGWFAFLMYTLIKFRARPGHKATYAPKLSKFPSYLEIGIDFDTSEREDPWCDCYRRGPGL